MGVVRSGVCVCLQTTVRRAARASTPSTRRRRARGARRGSSRHRRDAGDDEDDDFWAEDDEDDPAAAKALEEAKAKAMAKLAKKEANQRSLSVHESNCRGACLRQLDGVAVGVHPTHWLMYAQVVM